jgi:hypothetical protein
MKQPFVITHTIYEVEILALIDSWVTNTPSFKMLSAAKITNAKYKLIT